MNPSKLHLRVKRRFALVGVAASALALAGFVAPTHAVDAASDEITVGDNHTCTEVQGCRGGNSAGQLGVIKDPSTVRAAGGNRTCSVADYSYFLYCSGSGLGATPKRILGVGGVPVKQLVTSSSHGCLITDLRATYCWGANGSGQLGNGSRVSSPLRATLVKAPTGVKFSQLAVGPEHTCAISSVGKVYCWGSQHAVGQPAGLGATVPTVKPGLSGLVARSLSVGSGHTCISDSAGAARCWGSNVRGQLGRGTTGGFSSTPATVVGLPAGAKVGSVAVGAQHSCAVLSSSVPAGKAYCWGRNDRGQLGNGKTADSSRPQAVAPLVTQKARSDFEVTQPSGFPVDVALAVGDRFNFDPCAGRTLPDAVKDYGCFGKGEADWRFAASPAGVLGLTQPWFEGLPQDPNSGTVHLADVEGLKPGTVTITGVIDYPANLPFYPAGSYTVTSTYTVVPTPTVSQELTFTAMALGAGHTCGASKVGDDIRGSLFAYCWGANSSKQLGIGASGDTDSPAYAGILRNRIVIGAS